jgi:hypothetical protein
MDGRQCMQDLCNLTMLLLSACLCLCSVLCLFVQTTRIVLIQSGHILTQYLQDQLKEEVKRDLLVREGKMSYDTANKEAEKWAEVRRDVDRERDTVGEHCELQRLSHAVLVWYHTHIYILADNVMYTHRKNGTVAGLSYPTALPLLYQSTTLLSLS